MSEKLKFILFIFFILSLFFSSFYIKDFRIDASSDSFVSQNDEDFKYFSYYQDLFPTKNSLVIAIKGNEVSECGIKEGLKVVDLTGAGDLFAAGFLHGYINNLSLKDSLEKGTEMSAKVIQQIGARL